MDLIQLVTTAITLLQQNEQTLSAGAAVVTMGSTAVQLFQKGKQVVTYWISHREDAETKTAPPIGGAIGAAGHVTVVPIKSIAIVVDINQHALQDVARYLQKHEIDADLFLVTNDAAYGPNPKFLSANDSEAWTQIVEDFRSVWQRIKFERGHVPAHIFMSVPVAIAFGMGAVWGTVDHAKLYHWAGREYLPALEIDRGLRDPNQRE